MLKVFLDLFLDEVMQKYYFLIFFFKRLAMKLELPINKTFILFFLL